MIDYVHGGSSGKPANWPKKVTAVPRPSDLWLGCSGEGRLRYSASCARTSYPKH